MQKYVIFGVLILSMITGAVIYQHTSGRSGLSSGVEVDWRLLGDMDYITGKSTSELQALSGKVVKIPGFMVPLEDSQKEVTEFLLVPTPQACIHVPAPPPNQMVYVKMRMGSNTQVAFGPIWVYGVLNLVTKKSMYGEASFELVGEMIEPYK
jgi:hypothetical protein